MCKYILFLLYWIYCTVDISLYNELNNFNGLSIYNISKTLNASSANCYDFKYEIISYCNF